MTEAVIKELTPPGFNYFGADRLNKRAGGLAIPVKEQFNFKQLSSSKYETFEQLDIKSVISKLKLVVVYRPSSLHQFIADITSYFSELTLSADNLLIIGDLNLHLEVSPCPWCQRL